MDGHIRRKKIMEHLNSEIAVSASKLAEKYSVSRQIIVGDIALLRASGKEIMSTSKGYKLHSDDKDEFIGKIVCQHSLEETEEELTIIVKAGGRIMDVVVEHPIYGEMVGKLYIATLKDVKDFIEQQHQHKAPLLSVLTNGIHIHTVATKDEETFEKIKQELKLNHFLYVNE